MVLQHVQELRLQVRAHFRDFVEENRAFVGQFKLARLASHGAREGSLFESKQFRLKQFSRQRCAVHLDKWLVAPL